MSISHSNSAERVTSFNASQGEEGVREDVEQVKSGFMKLAGHLDAAITKITKHKLIQEFKKNSPNAYLVTAALVAAVALVAISASLSYVSTALYILAGAIVLYSALKAGGKKWFPEQTQKVITNFEKFMESLYGKFKKEVQASGEKQKPNEEQKPGLFSRLFSKRKA